MKHKDTKTELLSVVRLDDNDEIDDQSEEVNKPEEKEKQAIRFLQISIDKSKRRCRELERVIHSRSQLI